MSPSSAMLIRKRLLHSLFIVLIPAAVLILIAAFFPQASVETSVSSDLSVQQAYNSAADELKVAASEAKTDLNDIRKQAAENDSDLLEEYNQLTALTQQYSTAETLDSWVGYNKTPEENKQAVEDIKAVTQQSVSALKTRVKDWAEKTDAIVNIPVAGETPDERIQRLQQLVGQPFKYRIGECRDNDEDEYILGCYTPGDDFYTITETGLKSKDCLLRKTIVHEHQHYQQWVEGLTSEWSTEQLEADARAHEYLAGC